MSKHRRPDAEPVERTEVREVWGLLLPHPTLRVLRSGYSERPFTSADDVLKDFEPALREVGTPVLLERITTVHYEYRSSP